MNLSLNDEFAYALHGVPPVGPQVQYRPRRGEIDLIVLHTPEWVYYSDPDDLVDYLRRRQSPGSYHYIPHYTGVKYVIHPDYEAFGVKYGYNKRAIHVSLMGSARNYQGDWRSNAKLSDTVENAVELCANLCEHYGIDPIIVSKREVDEGMSGITTHGILDPDRRWDPGFSQTDLAEFSNRVRDTMRPTSSRTIAADGNIVGMCPNYGGGYYLYTDRGAVYAFGAEHYGGANTLHLNQPIVDMSAINQGYYLLGADGGVFAYGRARYQGAQLGINAVSIMAYREGEGYLVLDDSGKVWQYGRTDFRGDFIQGVSG